MEGKGSGRGRGRKEGGGCHKMVREGGGRGGENKIVGNRNGWGEGGEGVRWLEEREEGRGAQNCWSKRGGEKGREKWGRSRRRIQNGWKKGKGRRREKKEGPKTVEGREEGGEHRKTKRKRR